MDKFLELLSKYTIQVIIVVRSFPTSKVEHFKKENMEKWLPEHKIEYLWLGKELRGYRHGGYKRHMRTKLLREGIKQLLVIANVKRACVMCMETDQKYCYRRFISAYPKRKGVKVLHIMEKGRKALPTYTPNGSEL